MYLLAHYWVPYQASSLPCTPHSRIHKWALKAVSTIQAHVSMQFRQAASPCNDAMQCHHAMSPSDIDNVAKQSRHAISPYNVAMQCRCAMLQYNVAMQRRNTVSPYNIAMRRCHAMSPYNVAIQRRHATSACSVSKVRRSNITHSDFACKRICLLPDPESNLI